MGGNALARVYRLVPSFRRAHTHRHRRRHPSRAAEEPQGAPSSSAALPPIGEHCDPKAALPPPATACPPPSEPPQPAGMPVAGVKLALVLRAQAGGNLLIQTCAREGGGDRGAGAAELGLLLPPPLGTGRCCRQPPPPLLFPQARRERARRAGRHQ